MLRIRWIVVVSLMFLIGCGKQSGLPVESSMQGVHYYFPKVSIVVKTEFTEKCQFSENSGWYKKKLLSDMKESTYFLEVSQKKQPYQISVTYTQYTYTSWGSKVVSWFTPSAVFGGIDLDIGYELVIRITHHGREIEKYIYKEDYVSKTCDVHTEGKRFFEKSINNFLKNLPYKSKMKKIKVNKKD